MIVTRPPRTVPHRLHHPLGGVYFRTAGGAPSSPVLLTVPEACAALRISRWSFYELVRRRRLRTVRIGNRRLVPAAALRELVAALEAEAGL